VAVIEVTTNAVDEKAYIPMTGLVAPDANSKAHSDPSSPILIAEAVYPDGTVI